MTEEYVELKDLVPYKLAVQLGRECWKIYERLGWQDRKIIGDQFITAADSIGANIAEGYGRFHYLDRIKFYYNSRGSLLESKHWVLVLKERSKINEEEYNNLVNNLDDIHKKLNIYIKSCYASKNN